MRTVLVFPPVSDPAHPPIGLPSLAGFLRARGEEVRLLDLNIDAYNTLLSSASIARFSARLRDRLASLEAERHLPPATLEEYQAVAEALMSSDVVMRRIDEARARLRQADTYASRRAYAEVTSIVRRALQLVSATHFPASWCPGGFTMRQSSSRSADVLAAVDDRQQNLFLPLLKRAVLGLRATQPDLVGISLNYYCQMIPAITLASLVKRHLPHAFVVIGGGLVGFFERSWEVLAPFASLVDGWIPFEGEVPLYGLVRAVQAGRGLDGVDGLLRFEAGQPVYRAAPRAPHISELPAPSFDGLPLGDYLAPRLVLPLLTSRGCYWGRCAFCSHPHLYRGRFHRRQPEDVVQLMHDLAARHGATCFYLVDEAIPPHSALRLADLIADAGPGYEWFGEARLEAGLSAMRAERLRAGGCRMLMFGLESGVDRVLTLMEKGVSRAVAAAALDACAQAGIRTFVMFFVGFPSETRDEADKTIEFVESFGNRIAHAAFTQFVLERHAPAFRDPARYGIAEVCPVPDEDLKTWFPYRVERGLTSEEAKALVQEMQRHPGLRPPGHPYLISRSHLAFLPLGERSEIDRADTPEPDLTRWERIVPQRREGLVPLVLTFNLDEVRAELARPEAGRRPIGRCPTQYVFDADGEKLVEVGRDGLRLLAVCDGRFTLEEIVSAASATSRDTTLRFLSDLHARSLIRWQVRP